MLYQEIKINIAPQGSVITVEEGLSPLHHFQRPSHQEWWIGSLEFEHCIIFNVTNRTMKGSESKALESKHTHYNRGIKIHCTTAHVAALSQGKTLLEYTKLKHSLCLGGTYIFKLIWGCQWFFVYKLRQTRFSGWLRESELESKVYITVEPPIKDPPRKGQPLIKDTPKSNYSHLKPPRRGHPLYNGHYGGSQSVLCSEVPLYCSSHC